MSLLCENIKRLRTLKGLTQKQLAGILGISSKTVSKWETGSGQPEVDQIVPLARVFGVSIDNLFLGTRPLDSDTRMSDSESGSVQKELEKIHTQYRIPLEFLLQISGAQESDLKDLIAGKAPTGKENQEKRKKLIKFIIVFGSLIPRYVENSTLLISTLFTKLRLENEVPIEAIESYANLTPGTINAFLSGNYPLTQKAICNLITVLFMLDASINCGEAFPMEE